MFEFEKCKFKKKKKKRASNKLFHDKRCSDLKEQDHSS